MSAVSQKSRLDSLLEMLECPVGLEPLTTAVTLVPCCHKINAAFAESLYGIVRNHACTKANQPCHRCRQIVIAYYPDTTIRELVTELLSGVDRPEAPHSAPVVVEEEEKSEGLPYPGERGEFTLFSDNARYLTTVPRAICFYSSRASSLFSKVEICETFRGVTYLLVASKYQYGLKRYFESKQLNLQYMSNGFDDEHFYIEGRKNMQ